MSDDVEDTKADCYSGGERTAMEWWQELRAKWLAPALMTLTRVGVNSDHLTLISLALGLAFCPLIFVAPIAAFVCLFLHILVDGLDGPLARYQGTASKAGSFTDTMSDQTVVVATTITMMAHPQQWIGVVPGSCYIFAYTLVVVFAMVRNALGVPYSWLVRPRFIVYGWLLLEFFVFSKGPLAHSIDIVLWVLNALLLTKILTGFLRIRAKI